jgi:glycyl-tRNA synthetase
MGDPDIVLPAAGDYLRLMEQNGLVVDQNRRRALIQQQVGALAAEAGGRVPEDEALLAEVTHLVESPTALLGQFDPAFLELPQEVLIAVMRKHQRYFPVVHPETGRLLPYFIAVRNGDREHLDVVRNGNEEVLRARYTDAAFFFKEDTQKPLEAFLPRLSTLTFQEKLGSVLDKVKRLEQAVPRLAGLLGVTGGDLETAVRVAHLCKADLGTQMVIELTSLQGIMGREYALRSGESPAVATAIFEHYLPRFAGDAAPQSMPGILTALADRLDSLLGLFAVGLSPSSAADPYGLRRAALGLVQTLVENRLSLSLTGAMERTADLQPVAVTAAAIQEVETFIIGRLRVWLREKGLRYDVVEAVLAARGDNPYAANETVVALSRWVERPDWSFILNTYGRCVRITREFKERFPLSPDAFNTESERRLHAAYLACRGQVSRDGSVDELLAAFQPMLEPINKFFDDVLVMDKDPLVRQNRLSLLQHIAALTDGIADLTQLEGF